MHYILIEYVKNYGPIKTNISAILIVNEGHTERLILTVSLQLTEHNDML
jgi:hypothetical protein